MVANRGVFSPTQAPSTLKLKYSSACSWLMPSSVTKTSMQMSRSYSAKCAVPQR